MSDMFKKATRKGWGDEWGDDWNVPCGHSKRRNEGRKRIKRAPRRNLKQELRKEIWG